MAIYFFDKNQTLIKIVPESATFEAIQTQELDDDSLLKDTLSVTVKGDEKLLNAEYMAVKSYTGNAQTFDMYRIVTDTTPDKSMSFTGMSLAPYELNGRILQDLRPANHSLSYTLNRVLTGTDWRVGYIEDGLSNVTTTFYYVSVKEALKELQSLIGCEFVFKVEISGQKITDKWIEVYSEMGNRTKKRFNYGTNALTVVRETNKADIFTALIGRGKGEEVSSGSDNASGQAGYGRKITFEDIEWKKSNGKPLDKPVGQYYLELPQATQAYGIKNIDGTMKARVGIVDFDDEEDKNRLINLTYQQLLVSSRPKVLFKTTVANIGATGIGDTVTIHRHDLNIHYQTRVRKIVRNKLNDNKTQIELGDAVVTASTKQAKQNNATIKNLNQELEKVKVDVTTSQTSADGKNTIFYGSAEPERQRTGDTWYRPHPSIAGETQMLVWNGNAWELAIDTSDLTSVSKAVNDAAEKADEAVEKADEAVNEINTAIQNAGFTSLDETLQNISGIASGVKSELDIAIENAGFTSLDDTLKSINRITTSAEQNAQQAITDASNAYGLAQTSISEAQTAQANSLTALSKADNALDGVSSLDVRVDDVEAELELKADNTFINEDGTLTTLSNAITFNAHRFSSDMSRIESRVESLAGEINLVILRDALTDVVVAIGDEYPNASETSIGRNTMRELIKVTQGESLAFSKETTDGFNWVRINHYDSNYNYIAHDTFPDNERILSIGDSTAFIWVSYPSGSQPQIVRGTEFLPYRPNMADQMTTNEMVLFRNEYDEFADRSERRLSAIDSTGGSLEVLNNRITTEAGLVRTDMTALIDKKVDGDDFSEFYQNEYLETAGEVSRKISLSDIEIGGRNLLVESELIRGRNINNSTTYQGASSSAGFFITPPKPIDGAKYLTASITVNHSFENLRIMFLDSNLEKISYHVSSSVLSQTWEVPSNAEYYVFCTHDLDGNKYKLEKGNKATDWTPAPEDTDAKFNHVQTEWKQTFDTLSQTVTGIDGRVTEQKQTIDTISSTVSGHGGRLSTVEQTASGLQSTVADKANQSQVTQLANGLNLLVRDKPINLIPDDSNLSESWNGWAKEPSVTFNRIVDNRTELYVGTAEHARIYYPLTLEKGKKYKITFEAKTHLAGREISVGRGTKNLQRIALSDVPRTYEAIFESDESSSFSIYFHSNGTFEIGNVQVMETTAVSSAQISVLSDSITSQVSGMEGRVNTRLQTIDNSLSAISEPTTGRLSKVEQTASGLQSAVASKASQSQVTQLATGLNAVVENMPDSLIPEHHNLSKGWTGWASEPNTSFNRVINNRTEIFAGDGNQRIYYPSLNLEKGKKYRITFDAVTHVEGREISVGRGSANTDRIALSTTSKSYEVIFESDATSSFSVFFHEYGTYEIGNIHVVETTAIGKGQMSVLSDNINLRVTKGELLSQINVQANGILIQSGTNKLNITPETTFIEDATIKSAMIESLVADKIKFGTLDGKEVNVINIDAENITANKTQFIQSNWNDIESSIRIDGRGLLSTASDGSQVYLQDGIVGTRNPSGATIGQIGYAYQTESPWYTMQTSYGSHFQIRMSRGAGELNKQAFYIISGGTESYLNTDNIYLNPSSSGRVSVQGNLNVDSTLRVEGTALVRSRVEYLNGGYIESQSANSNILINATNKLIIYTNGTNALEFDANNAVFRRKISDNSDIRLKTNIVDMPINSLEAIRNIEIKKFDYLDGRTNYYGIIAQQAQNYLPELINTDSDGYLMVDKSAMTYVNMHAIQQLDSKVDVVDNEVSKLKAQIASLQDELALLKGA